MRFAMIVFEALPRTSG